MVDQAVVEVLASQVGVTSSRSDLEDALLNGQQRDIKGTTSQVKDQHVLLLARSVLLIQTVSDGSRCRLVDDAQHIESSDDTCRNLMR